MSELPDNITKAFVLARIRANHKRRYTVVLANETHTAWDPRYPDAPPIKGPAIVGYREVQGAISVDVRDETPQ